MVTCVFILFLLMNNCAQDSTIVFSNSYEGENGKNSWIQSCVLGYIGRYHEYPKDGLSIIDYYEKSLNSDIEGDYGIDIKYGFHVPSLRMHKKVFLNKRNRFDKTSCMISFKKERYLFSKTITEWQEGLYKWILIYYKPAFYDKDGGYLFQLSDDLCDSFHNEMTTYVEQFPKRIRYKTDFEPLYRVTDVPLRVRIRYIRGGGGTIMEDFFVPKSTLYLKDDTNESSFDDTLINPSSVSSMIKLLEPFIQDYIQNYPVIYSVDCLVPLCLPPLSQ